MGGDDEVAIRAHAPYETPSATGSAAGSFLSGASRLLGEAVGALREEVKDLATDIARVLNGEEDDELGGHDVFSPF